MVETITAMDRCDNCGAQAYVHVLFETGDLLFCNHHYTKNKDAIAGIAIEITDESDRLYPNKASEEEVE